MSMDSCLQEMELINAQNEVLLAWLQWELSDLIPFDTDIVDSPLHDPYDPDRFEIQVYLDDLVINDHHTYDSYVVPRARLLDPEFNFRVWITSKKADNAHALYRGLFPANEQPAHDPEQVALPSSPTSSLEDFSDLPDLIDVSESDLVDSDSDTDEHSSEGGHTRTSLYLGAIQTRAQKKVAPAEQVPLLLERTAARAKDATRLVPSSLVVVVTVNGKPARALIDSGSLSDFMSTSLADSLKLEQQALEKPITLQLAVSGSHTKINYTLEANLVYQEINEPRAFDICNLDSYDIILGTPFLFQHQVLFGLNPNRIFIGSVKSLPLKGDQVSVIASRAAELVEPRLEQIRAELREYASDIYENFVMPFRPSRCPDPLRPLWREKRDAYMATGRWETRPGTNAVPMLILKKPDSGDGHLLTEKMHTSKSVSNPNM